MTGVPQIIAGIIETLDRLAIRYMIGGSFASSAWGQPRQTNDLDLDVLLEPEQLQELYAAVKEEFLVSEAEMQASLVSRDPFRSFQLLHFEETFKIDVFVLHRNSYTEAALARAIKRELLPDLQAAFMSPEDIVITKLRWYVLGNRVSDRQWNDIVQVLELQAGQLDEGYLVQWAEHFEVLDLLRRAQEEIVT